jgi:hypothetical protein
LLERKDHPTGGEVHLDGANSSVVAGRGPKRPVEGVYLGKPDVAKLDVRTFERDPRAALTVTKKAEDGIQAVEESHHCGFRNIVGYHGPMSGAIPGDSSESASAPSTAGAPIDATDAVAAARRGFKRDVEGLIRAFRKSHLFVPLAKRIENVPLGVDQTVEDELSLTPQFLFDPERIGFLPVFTRTAFVERATEQVGWTTDDGPLEYCTLPGPAVLELGLAVVDDERIGGLIVNPFQETELMLRRHELASIAQGKPIPLVGYVSELPFSQDEQRLIAEMDGPLPEELVAAVEGVLAEVDRGLSYGLHRTFTPERDLEPHLTLNVLGGAETLDRHALGQKLFEALEGYVPPPGYIDIVFDDEALGAAKPA